MEIQITINLVHGTGSFESGNDGTIIIWTTNTFDTQYDWKRSYLQNSGGCNQEEHDYQWHYNVSSTLQFYI